MILDEPTAGLDPLERIRLRNYISTIAKDKIVLIATHVMQDIETIAKEILFIKEGNLLFEGSITELIERLKGRVQETLIDEVGESSVLPSLEDAYLYYMG